MQNKANILRKKTRVRSKFVKEGYRLSIDRSGRYLFAQVVDQKNGKTIFGMTDKNLIKKEEGKTKTIKANDFGVIFAKDLLKKDIKKVMFDRGAYKYHGRVKAFAEGIRQGGVQV
jgi:large subunit ribosomal protein L18